MTPAPFRLIAASPVEKHHPSGVMPPKTPMKRAMKAGGAMKAQSKSQKLLQAADEIDAFVSSRAKKEDTS